MAIHYNRKWHEDYFQRRLTLSVHSIHSAEANWILNISATNRKKNKIKKNDKKRKNKKKSKWRNKMLRNTSSIIHDYIVAWQSIDTIYSGAHSSISSRKLFLVNHIMSKAKMSEKNGKFSLVDCFMFFNLQPPRDVTRWSCDHNWVSIENTVWCWNT